MASKLVPLLPIGRVYVEPYCGMASLFWAKPYRHEIEVLNDINGDVINLFRVLQDEQMFERFFHKLLFTPYSLDEYRRAIAYDGDDPVERAWALYIAANQGFSGRVHGATDGNWGRTFTSNNGVADVCSAFRSKLKLLAWWHKRLGGVQLDNRDALEVIRYWDSPETVFYIDPPYVLDTRQTKDAYEYEADDEHHKKLVELLLELNGNVLLSGYDNELYKPLEDAGWYVQRFDTCAFSAGATRSVGNRSRADMSKRVEVVWIKGAKQISMF